MILFHNNTISNKICTNKFNHYDCNTFLFLPKTSSASSDKYIIEIYLGITGYGP